MSAKPVRRRRNDKSQVPVSFLPEGNRSARWAYLSAIFGIIPGLGIAFGPVAVVLSFFAARVAAKDEFNRGKGHANISRFFGSIETVTSVAGWACLSHALGWV